MNDSKATKMGRTILGFILGLVVFAISGKILMVSIGEVCSLVLGIAGVHGPDNVQTSQDVGNIFGLIAGVYIGNKVYKKMTRKNVDPNAPIIKKKWWQFGGFA